MNWIVLPSLFLRHIELLISIRGAPSFLRKKKITTSKIGQVFARIIETGKWQLFQAPGKEKVIKQVWLQPTWPFSPFD